MSTHKAFAAQNVVFIRRLSNVVGITIPKHIMEALEWKEGDILVLQYENGRLTAQKGKVEVAQP